MNEPTTTYALGSSDHEIERLDRQSASIESATRLLLRAAGIQPGMRVLDLGTGNRPCGDAHCRDGGARGARRRHRQQCEAARRGGVACSRSAAAALRGRRCARLARRRAVRCHRRPLDPVPPGRPGRCVAAPRRRAARRRLVAGPGLRLGRLSLRARGALGHPGDGLGQRGVSPTPAPARRSVRGSACCWPKRAWRRCRVSACRATSHPPIRAGRRCSAVWCARWCRRSSRPAWPRQS